MVSGSACKRASYVHGVCQWLAAAVFLGACVDTHTRDVEARDAQADAAEDEGVLAKIPEAVRADLEAGRARELLIELVDRAEPDAGVLDAGDAQLARSVRPEDEAESLREHNRQLQERVLSGSASVELLFQYENVPLLHVGVQDLPGLLSLVRQREVLLVHENRQTDSHLAESLPLISQPAVAAIGQLGAGTAVAVLDTGCDYVRPAFGSCSNPGGNCKVAYASDFGTSDNVRDTSYHGTNVSAIVLGVAPATKILALDVFEGQYASASTIIRAIDWVISNRARYNIVAMNMSLGSGSYSAQCGSDVFATAIGNARNAGILSAISSGNSSTTSAISSPACVPTAISVGAVYDANVGGVRYSGCNDGATSADKVTCFSSSATFLSVLAPGAPITAGGITMSGTSQAAPHVAGAIAVARGAFPTEPIGATVSRLVDNGPSITDPRNGVTVHRLDLHAALGGTGMADVTAPSGTLRINQGAASTRAQVVDLALSASDDGGAVSVCVSNTPTCTAFTAFTASRTWSLTNLNGMKTVYVTLRDPSNNRTTFSASILFDSAAPSRIMVAATSADAQVQLSWSAATDAHSGISGYQVYAIANSTNAPSCGRGALIYSGTGTSFTHSALTNGAYYAYRVCPVDGAGNVGTGAVATARPIPELDGPTGSVSINQGATYTTTANVTLSISAFDVSGVAAMCISNSNKCSTYSAYSSTRAWKLANANGGAVVRVWFRDTYGNVSATAASASIILDSQPPTPNTISAVADDGAVTLRWTPSSDVGTGLAGYRVVVGRDSVPSCATGGTVYIGPGLSAGLNGFTNGALYHFRICPFDVAGNDTSGGTTWAKPAPEFVGPTGTVLIDQGAQYTGSRNVTLALSATDVSGVTGVCISNFGTCSNFTAFTPTKAWTLSAATGPASVQVWFQDTYGNVSAAATTDTIIVDTTAPSANRLTAVATSGAATLSWTASADAGSGIAGYRLRYALNRAPSCTTGTEVYSGTALSFTHTGLSNGSTYAYRVCPFDAVGNVTAAGTVLALPR